MITSYHLQYYHFSLSYNQLFPTSKWQPSTDVPASFYPCSHKVYSQPSKQPGGALKKLSRIVSLLCFKIFWWPPLSHKIRVKEFPMTYKDLNDILPPTLLLPLWLHLLKISPLFTLLQSLNSSLLLLECTRHTLILEVYDYSLYFKCLPHVSPELIISHATSLQSKVISEITTLFYQCCNPALAPVSNPLILS